MQNDIIYENMSYEEVFEILTFDLGTIETFGVNVFKVHEVLKRPEITRTPNAPMGLKGNISLRGNILPVVGLAELMNLGKSDDESQGILIIGEVNEKRIGLLVNSVDKIVRVNWDKIETPDNVLSSTMNNDITGVVNVNDKLISIIDIESILSRLFVYENTSPIKGQVEGVVNVMFVDESSMARKRIAEILEKMNIQAYAASNGEEAYHRLVSLINAGTKIDLVLTDIEMPKMNGYELVKRMKGSPLLKEIPVLMFSSLSTVVSKQQAEKMGAEDYVVKFHMEELSDKILQTLYKK